MSVKRSEHEAKFDRQMRLWGGHGQMALENANLCCFGSGPTASETLKNLVLPNVKHFTIVDDAVVTEADTGNNFFVDDESIGKPRAQVVSDLLTEMNPAVEGQVSVKSCKEVIEKDINFVNKFTLVIASCLGKASLLTLAEHCEKQGLPLIVVQSYGLVGYVRLQIPEHTIIESHYDNDRMDLYLNPDQTKHFPELQKYIEQFDLSENTEYFQWAHTPFASVLGQYVKKWTAAHNGTMPKTFAEKKEFKQAISSVTRRDPEDPASGLAENYREAERNAYRCYDQPQLDHLTAKTVNDSRASINALKSTAPSDPNIEFWICCQALQRFMTQTPDGLIPCSTTIPDMTSLPDNYVRLKEIYTSRAAKDLAQVTEHVGNVLKEIGRDTPISSDFISHFVKNCRGLRVIRTRSLAEEEDAKQFPLDDITELYEEWRDVSVDESIPEEERPPIPPRMIQWYFALRAVHDFEKKHNRYPGAGNVDLQADVAELMTIQTTTMMSLGLNQQPVSECLEELVRCGGTEIHNTAAMIGGVGAQAALKVITKQYVPLNNTFIFDGIFGQSSMLTV